MRHFSADSARAGSERLRKHQKRIKTPQAIFSHREKSCSQWYRLWVANKSSFHHETLIFRKKNRENGTQIRARAGLLHFQRLLCGDQNEQVDEKWQISADYRCKCTIGAGNNIYLSIEQQQGHFQKIQKKLSFRPLSVSRI